jgi:hypothetical protein
MFLQNLGGRRGLFRRRRLEADERRTIRHVRANDQGEFDPNNNNWATFHFYGRSVFNLRMQVGIRQDGGAGEYGDGITLAVQPGLHGRLTPLVTDLPRSVDPMDIVVFNTGSQGEKLCCSLSGLCNTCYLLILPFQLVRCLKLSAS